MAGNKTTGHLLALFSVIVWGSTFIFSKFLLNTFTPVQIMLVRFIVAYTALLVMKPVFYKTTPKDELIFVLLSIFGGSLYFWAENTALIYTFASNVSIIVTAAPIITAILAHFFTKGERLNKNIFIGFIFAFCGVALVVFNGSVVLKFNPLGDILSFCAALSWAFYGIILNEQLKKFDNFMITRRMMLYGAAAAFFMVLAENKPFHIESLLDWKTAGSFLFLGVVGSALCYVLWNSATKKIGVVSTNNYIYVIPFVTMLAASIFLNEKITLMAIAGTVLIILGIVFSERQL